MGWLHVANDGYGVFLTTKIFNFWTMIENVPKLGVKIDRDFIETYARNALKRKTTTSQRYEDLANNFAGYPSLDKMNEEQRIMFLAWMGRDVGRRLWVNGKTKSFEDVTPDDVQEFLDGLKEDKYESSIWEIFSILFCQKYGYPQKAFKSCTDYYGYAMFYCTARFPISKGEEALCGLTEEKYIEQLSEFFSILTGTDYKAELDFCEEYIKD